MENDSNIPDFKVESYIEQKTGKYRLKFYWKRKPALSITLKGPEAEQLAGYAQMSSDLAKVVKWAKLANTQFSKEIKLDEGVRNNHFHLEDRESADIIKGLFVAALTFYGKAFTKASGRKVKLDKSSLDAKFHETHEFFMDYRHNFAAHGGDMLLEHKVTTLVLIGKPKSGFKPVIHTANLQPDHVMPIEGVYGLDELAEHAIDVATRKYNYLSDRITNSHILPLGEKYWQTHAKTGKSYTLQKIR